MPLTIEENYPLAPLTTVGLGGAAQFFTRVTSESELLQALSLAKKNNWPIHLLGGGSNLVVADAGVCGLVIHCQLKGISWLSKTKAHVSAGEDWDSFTQLVSLRNLSGIECLGGIPGQVGSTPIQNVGAYGQEVSQTITSVKTIKLADFSTPTFSNKQCQFDYRDSYFKKHLGKFIVTSVCFELSEEKSRLRNPELAQQVLEQELNPSEIRERVIRLRRKKSMVLDLNDPNTRSCGSFFVNVKVTAEQLQKIKNRVKASPPAYEQADGLFKVPSAWLIEQAGFKKGTQRGKVGLSTRHTLALTAQADATTQELLSFASEIQITVLEHFGVRLEPEPRMWGFDDQVPAFPLR